MVLCLPRRDAANRTARSFDDRDGGPTALSRRMLFFFVIGAFSDVRLLRPRTRRRSPLCRNKVTLLLVTLRSGTLTRAFLRYLRRCRDAGLYRQGNYPRILKILW